MDFNLDDPLAGILSDGSDDSFFDDDIVGKKKPTKKKETPIAEKKSMLFDLGEHGDVKSKPQATSERKDSLFGLGDDDIKKVTPHDNLKPTEKKASPSLFRRTDSKDSISFKIPDTTKEKLDSVTKSPNKPKLKAIIGDTDDTLDFLDEIDKGNKKEVSKPLERGKSSQSLLDDILGGAQVKTSSQTRPTTTGGKNQEFDFDSILAKSDSKQTLSSTKTSKQSVNTIAPKLETQPKKDNQPKKKANEDWLGIFNDKDTDELEDDTGMPSWLAGGDTKKKKQVEESKKQTTESKPKTPIKEDPAEPTKVHEIPQGIGLNLDRLNTPITTTQMLNKSNEDITAEGATLFLQQQETQLMVALQLKAQEEKLAAMQMRQEETTRVRREAARAQQAQVDAILRRQAENRLQMQSVIAEHQDRITQRIKALLGPAKSDPDTEGEDNSTQVVDKESPHSKEKKQLLQLVQSLQENHDKEIDLMETSYRRQLAFLEISLNQSEERMKEESDKAVKFYSEKIHWLEEHHQLHKKLTEENLDAMTNRQKTENEMLRQQHLENIKILQEHHVALMENIKNAVKQEQVLIQDSTEFSSNLTDLVSDVKETKTQFQLLVNKVQSIADNTQKENDRSLQARETQINDMLQQLKKDRENFETEKNESREMVKLLENRLRQMTSLIEEESATLKQKRMEFEFEKATFSKQTEFAKNVLKKQDEEIKMIKEDIQKEYQEKISRIDEEKSKSQKDSLAVSKEKSAILNLRQELERMKAELQAQLEEVNEQRSKLNMEKQQTHLEEQRILARSRDLDLLAKAAVEKQSQADKKYSEAEFIQRKYEERIRRIQEHVVSLNSREKQIAKEKVALSRERLNIHNERKQIESRQQCSLCKSTNMPEYSTFEPTYVLPESFLSVPVTRDYGGTNINSAMNAVESEMAHLLGRNFGLRHTVNIATSDVDHQESDHEPIDNKFESIKREAADPFKDYMDPKFMMLRLDVQQVISNLEQNKNNEDIEEQSYTENNKEQGTKYQ